MITVTRTRVFVYGTLRRGERNHYLLETSHFSRVGRTEPRFTLVSFGPFPAMVEGGTCAVVGEVYEVDDETLKALDRLEGHPIFYQRMPVLLDDGDEVVAYLLRGSTGGKPVIPSGDWLDASREGKEP